MSSDMINWLGLTQSCDDALLIQMTNPSVQNDFSYYRRTLSSMKMSANVCLSLNNVIFTGHLLVIRILVVCLTVGDIVFTGTVISSWNFS